MTTGHCQGKTCLSLTMDILGRKKGERLTQTTRIRAPIDPITLGSLVTKKENT